MDMNLTSEAGLRWVSAGALSLVLHVVVLALFAWSSGDSAADAVRHPEPASAPTEETSRQPEPTVEPKGASSEPEAAPKPVAAPSRPAPKVREPVREREAPKPKPADKVREPADANDAPASETYVVKKGDSLTHIAQDCGCTIQELAKLNGSTLKKLSNLRVGQKIKIPKR